MPYLDLSVALTNPYTLDKFKVTRRTITVNEFGESESSNVVVPVVYGVVTASGGNQLDREHDAQYDNKAIEIVTRYALRSASTDAATGANVQPDIVTWHSIDFLVEKVADYSEYGRGFVRADCTAMGYIQQAEVDH